jgi:hypothetical protein
MYIITNITDHLVRIAAILAIMPVSTVTIVVILEIPPNKYVGEVCTSAKVSSTDRGIPMIFSVATEQCIPGTANGALMMKKQLRCNSAPNLQKKI